jgi:hypothetical protein
VLHKTRAGKANFNTQGFEILTDGSSNRQLVFTGWPAASVAKSITFAMRSRDGDHFILHTRLCANRQMVIYTLYLRSSI